MLMNIWLVARHAIRTTMFKRSFWILTLLLPAIMFGMLVFTQKAEDSMSDESTEQETLQSLPKIGLVDEAGLVEKLPERFPPDLFTRYPNLNAAQATLEAGVVDQYLFIPANYLATGEITAYQKEFLLFSNGENMGLAYGSEGAWLLEYLINYNLTGNEQIALLMINPMPGDRLNRHIINPPPAQISTDADERMNIAFTMPYLFYFVLIFSSGYLLQSVAAEKENRTAEVLLLSVSPRALMFGKILGLGVVTLSQLTVWGASSLIVNRANDTLISGVMKFFTPTLMAWLVLYLLLGYLLYGSIMAAAGALAPTAREGGQVTTLMIIPLVPTLLFINEFAENPQGMLPLVLSLFPLTAPSSMVTRLSLAPVPVWQLAVSLAGVILTVYLFISLAARFFRADHLLSNESFSWKRFMRAWK